MPLSFLGHIYPTPVWIRVKHHHYRMKKIMFHQVRPIFCNLSIFCYLFLALSLSPSSSMYFPEILCIRNVLWRLTDEEPAASKPGGFHERIWGIQPVRI